MSDSSKAEKIAAAKKKVRDRLQRKQLMCYVVGDTSMALIVC